MEVGAYKAKVHFAKLLQRAARGERITITKRGRPIAELRRSSEQPDHKAFDEAWSRLEARRKNRPKSRNPLTNAEIISAKNEGRR